MEPDSPPDVFLAEDGVGALLSRGGIEIETAAVAPGRFPERLLTNVVSGLDAVQHMARRNSLVRPRSPPDVACWSGVGDRAGSSVDQCDGAGRIESLGQGDRAGDLARFR